MLQIRILMQSGETIRERNYQWNLAQVIGSNEEP